MAIATIACNFNPEFNNGLPDAPDGHKTGINDLYIDSSGSFVVLTGFEAVRQAIRQFMQLWLSEFAFNAAVGNDYLSVFNSSSQQGGIILDNIIRLRLDTYMGGTTDQWHCHENWNAYLQKNHSAEDFIAWNTQVISVSNTFDNLLGLLTVTTQLGFGNGQTDTIVVTANNQNIAIDEKPVTEKIKLKEFTPNQESIQVQIAAPDNFIIESGGLMVRLKVGGVYSNVEPIITSEYTGTLLRLPLVVLKDTSWFSKPDPYMVAEWKYLSKYVKVINVL